MAYEAQSTHGDDPAHHDEHEEHHVSSKTFIMVFVALCILTTASIITYTPLWTSVFTRQTGWAFMMAVSCAKAMLVITFFMHLLWEANWKYVLTIPAAMMSVFLICMLVPDIGYRTRHYAEEREFHDAVPHIHLETADGEQHAPAASH